MGLIGCLFNQKAQNKVLIAIWCILCGVIWYFSYRNMAHINKNVVHFISNNWILLSVFMVGILRIGWPLFILVTQKYDCFFVVFFVAGSYIMILSVCYFIQSIMNNKEIKKILKHRNIDI